MSTDAAADLAPPPRRRRTWLTVLLCLLIFGGGLAVGGGATALWVVRHVRDAVQHPEAAPHRLAERLQRKLDLDDQQAAQVEDAIQLHHAELLEARADFLERIEPILDRVDEDVASVLPASRIAEWRRQFRRFRDDWIPRPERPRRPPPPRSR